MSGARTYADSPAKCTLGTLEQLPALKHAPDLMVHHDHLETVSRRPMFVQTCFMNKMERSSGTWAVEQNQLRCSASAMVILPGQWHSELG